MYSVDAFMFANNNFYYNTDSVTDEQRLPESGFQVFGSYMAVNQVVVLRDWYDADPSAQRNFRAADYDPKTGEWKDAINGTLLTKEQIDSLRHYSMRIGYDDRIRDAATQMKGLPRGKGSIFTGMVGWEEIFP